VHGLASSAGRAHRAAPGRGRGRGPVGALVVVGVLVVGTSAARQCTGWPAAQAGRTGSWSWSWSWAVVVELALAVAVATVTGTTWAIDQHREPNRYQHSQAPHGLASSSTRPGPARGWGQREALTRSVPAKGKAGREVVGTKTAA